PFSGFEEKVSEFLSYNLTALWFYEGSLTDFEGGQVGILDLVYLFIYLFIYLFYLYGTWV
ncbi:MAG: hypothetical protein NW900_02180, partial [Candidatus Blochmannia sp. A2]|nr:hypothetical protein [Candidatus Blochmannia sp. A2]